MPVRVRFRNWRLRIQDKWSPCKNFFLHVSWFTSSSPSVVASSAVLTLIHWSHDRDFHIYLDMITHSSPSWHYHFTYYSIGVLTLVILTLSATAFRAPKTIKRIIWYTPCSEVACVVPNVLKNKWMQWDAFLRAQDHVRQLANSEPRKSMSSFELLIILN